MSWKPPPNLNSGCRRGGREVGVGEVGGGGGGGGVRRPLDLLGIVGDRESLDFGLPRLVQPGAAGHCALVQQAVNIILQSGSARTVASTRAKEKIRIDLDFS